MQPWRDVFECSKTLKWTKQKDNWYHKWWYNRSLHFNRIAPGIYESLFTLDTELNFNIIFSLLSEYIPIVVRISRWSNNIQVDVPLATRNIISLYTKYDIFSVFLNITLCYWFKYHYNYKITYVFFFVYWNKGKFWNIVRI